MSNTLTNTYNQSLNYIKEFMLSLIHIFSDMNDLGSLFQPNPLFISSNIRSLPPRLL